jgi:malate dehydrogenase
MEKFLTDEKLLIVGAAGMIGSNMSQCALMMRLSSNLCLYDIFSPEGVAEELRHCAFPGAKVTATTNAEEAFKDAKYIISSGGAPRKEGMTREDLLAGNAGVAKELGENIKKFCPDVKHVVIIFNPADITGLVTLIYSGLKPSQLNTLAALDSTRLQSALAKHFGVMQCAVKNCCTFGGHGEQMAVFASPVTIDGTPLLDIIGTGKAVNGKTLSKDEWEAMKTAVTQGGSAIIKLRGRSSFQSPAYVSIEMIAGAMGGEEFTWPAGIYCNTEKYHHIMMSMPTLITKNGAYRKDFTGTDEELASLDKSYSHLCDLRDQVIKMGIIPATDKWSEINPNLK